MPASLWVEVRPGQLHLISLRIFKNDRRHIFVTVGQGNRKVIKLSADNTCYFLFLKGHLYAQKLAGGHTQKPVPKLSPFPSASELGSLRST